MLKEFKLGNQRTHLDHIGIAVKDLEKVISIYELIGFTCKDREVIEDQGVQIALLLGGETRVELLASIKDSSPLNKFISNRGEGLHHIAVMVPNILETLSMCQDKGISVIDKKPRIGAGGSKIAFLHPKSTGGVLLELIEGKPWD